MHGLLDGNDIEIYCTGKRRENMKKHNKTITSKEFDERFDKCEDMTGFLNVKKAQANKHTQRINIDFPNAFLVKIDKEAKKIGVVE